MTAVMEREAATAVATNMEAPFLGTLHPRWILVETVGAAARLCHRREDPSTPVAVTTRILATIAIIVAKDDTALRGVDHRAYFLGRLHGRYRRINCSTWKNNFYFNLTWNLKLET